MVDIAKPGHEGRFIAAPMLAASTNTSRGDTLDRPISNLKSRHNASIAAKYKKAATARVAITVLPTNLNAAAFT
jgi:hypothetical protein